MRRFARPFPLARLSLEARVLYSAFLVFVLAGVITSGWLYRDDGFGLGAIDVVRYYRGGEAVLPSSAAAAVSDGPALELPAEAPTTLRMEKPARQVVETLHFHAFSMPVVLLIVGHIFMMCALPTWLKVAALLAASTSTLLHMLLPPLVRFSSPAWAALFPPSAIAMAASWIVLLVWPLVQMWRPSPPSDVIERG